MEKAKQLIINEIKVCENEFTDFISTRYWIHKKWILSQLRGDYILNTDDENTAWEYGYLAGMRKALAYL